MTSRSFGAVPLNLAGKLWAHLVRGLKIVHVLTAADSATVLRTDRPPVTSRSTMIVLDQ